jgi:hypothetical protein
MEMLGTLVIGAGYAGMAAGAVAAAKTNESVMVIEKGQWGEHGNHRDDLHTPSQDGMRGARIVDQTPELKCAIERSWQFMEEMRDATRIDPFLGRGDPYLMVVKDKGHFARIKEDVMLSGKTEGRDFATMSVADARVNYDIALPHGYAGVVDAGGCSTRLNTDALMDAYKITLENGGGTLLCGSEMVDYAERIDGKHYVKIRTHQDGQVLDTEYLVENLVVAGGVAAGAILSDMDAWHNAKHHQFPTHYMPPAEDGIPERFRPEHNFQVPQCTLYVRLPKAAQKRITDKKLGSVYMLDIDHTTPEGKKLCVDHLGFYVFSKPQNDGSVLIKIGYDPMAHISDNAQTAGQDPFADSQFAAQKTEMLKHIAKLFQVEMGELTVEKESICSYPLSTIGCPVCGISEQFHHVTLLAQQEGYGCMAAAGEYLLLLEGKHKQLPLGMRGSPDITVTEEHRARSSVLHGRGMAFPAPPSSDMPYLGAAHLQPASRGYGGR